MCCKPQIQIDNVSKGSDTISMQTEFLPLFCISGNQLLPITELISLSTYETLVSECPELPLLLDLVNSTLHGFKISQIATNPVQTESIALPTYGTADNVDANIVLYYDHRQTVQLRSNHALTLDLNGTTVKLPAGEVLITTAEHITNGVLTYTLTKDEAVRSDSTLIIDTFNNVSYAALDPTQLKSMIELVDFLAPNKWVNPMQLFFDNMDYSLISLVRKR